MAFVAARVAPHKRIRLLETIDAIPKSATGKILRRVLVEQERARGEGRGLTAFRVDPRASLDARCAPPGGALDRLRRAAPAGRRRARPSPVPTPRHRRHPLRRSPAAMLGRSAAGSALASSSARASGLDLRTAPVISRGIDLHDVGWPSSPQYGQTRAPRACSRLACGMPRIEPVPTAPAPPIWKIDLGATPAVRGTARSARRNAGCTWGGRGRPG